MSEKPTRADLGSAKIVLIRANRKSLLQRLGLEREDLLAIPLCLLGGFAYGLTSVSMPAISGLFQGGSTASGGGLAYMVAAAVSVPLNLVRQLFA